MIKIVLMAGASALALVAAPASAAVVFSSNTVGYSSFTVTQTGQYEIDAYGAAGGLGQRFNSQGGAGIGIAGIFNLIAGQTLSIAVGGVGGDGSYAGGGGGGSFVTNAGAALLIAGGGGGASYFGGGDAAATMGAGGGNGGDGGFGFYYFAGGGGGGGFNSAGRGGTGFYYSGGVGGDGAPSLQGRGGGQYSGGGGFGGGGGAGNSHYAGGGGGGGFNGGRGGDWDYGGGGGTSFNASADQRVLGTHLGTGAVVINALTAPVPEPTTWAQMMAGFGLLGLALRRRASKAPAKA